MLCVAVFFLCGTIWNPWKWAEIPSGRGPRFPGSWQDLSHFLKILLIIKEKKLSKAWRRDIKVISYNRNAWRGFLILIRWIQRKGWLGSWHTSHHKSRKRLRNDSNSWGMELESWCHFICLVIAHWQRDVTGLINDLPGSFIRSGHLTWARVKLSNWPFESKRMFSVLLHARNATVLSSFLHILVQRLFAKMRMPLKSNIFCSTCPGKGKCDLR